MTDLMIPLRVEVQHPSQGELDRGAASALALVEAFDVSDDATYEIAGDELRQIQTRRSQLDEQRKLITRPMDEAKKQVMDLFRGPLDVLDRAAGALKRKMLDYSEAREREAREARLVAERAAQAERDRIAEEARRLAAEGRVAEAALQASMAESIVAPPPAVLDAPRVEGVSRRETIDFEIVDAVLLIQHVAERPELAALVKIDSVALRQYLRGLGSSAKLPGVRVFKKATLAASRRG
jgi:hypothetical protein